MRFGGGCRRRRQYPHDLIRNCSHVKTFAPEHHVACFWVEDSKDKLSKVLWEWIRQRGYVQVVVQVLRCRVPPLLDPFVDVLEVVAKIDVAKRRVVSDVEYVPYRLALSGFFASLSPEDLCRLAAATSKFWRCMNTATTSLFLSASWAPVAASA